MKVRAPEQQQQQQRCKRNSSGVRAFWGLKEKKGDTLV